MEAPFFTSPMIETGRHSTLHFLNEGVDGGGASLLNEGRTSTLHFLCQEMVFDFPQKICHSCHSCNGCNGFIPALVAPHFPSDF